MKFCKKYEEFMKKQDEKLPEVRLKRLKKILKKCRRNFHPPKDQILDLDHDHDVLDLQYCQNQQCPVCDGTFFPYLLEEVSAVVGFFNQRARKLLELHLSSGLRKCVLWFKDRITRNHAALIQEGKDLVTYALINATAIRKILKKYDKIHYSKQGHTYKLKAQSMRIEILQSPLLCELMAFYINIREMKEKKLNLETSSSSSSSSSSLLFEGCSLKFSDGKPSLTCELFDSLKLDLDLTCSICLDTVFDSVSLKCGHIFCYMCACSAASVTIVDGLKFAEPKQKCPLCREARVYKGAVHMEELNILISRSCPEYWEKRLQTERAERLKQAKEHWNSQCRAFMGI